MRRVYHDLRLGEPHLHLEGCIGYLFGTDCIMAATGILLSTVRPNLITGRCWLGIPIDLAGPRTRNGDNDEKYDFGDSSHGERYRITTGKYRL